MLTYYLKSPEARGHMSGNQKGSSQQFLSLKQLRSLPIAVTEEPVMQKIIDILAVYDTLIETNQRQIKLLEEAAQRLYKEWFVDLRYPGHENVPVVDGVPIGWNRKRLVDIAEVQYGYAFDGHLFNNKKQGMPIIRIRNILDGITGDYTTESADEQYLVFNINCITTDTIFVGNHDLSYSDSSVTLRIYSHATSDSQKKASSIFRSALESAKNADKEDQQEAK